MSKQHGFSLPELMVAMVASMIVILGIVTVFAGTVKSNADSLRNTRLTQDMRTTLDFISAELRRAGYWSQSAVGSENTFGILQITDNCIRYSYEAPDGNDIRGFRVASGILLWSRDANSCNGGGSWDAITDNGVIEIDTSNPVFVNRSLCLNWSDGSDCHPCSGSYAQWAVNDILKHIRRVEINLTGIAVNDPNKSKARLNLRNEIQVQNLNQGAAITPGPGANNQCDNHIRVRYAVI